MFLTNRSKMKKMIKLSYSFGVISITLAMLMSVINFPVAASEVYQAAYNCSDFDLKAEGAGTESDYRGSITISSDRRRASWGANEGWVISAVCVKGGNPSNENGFYYEWSYPDFGSWTAADEQADISHAAVKFAVATPTPMPPTKTPTNTPETPTETPETPTVTPETPTVTPETPTVTPETPTVTPETPTVTPETPTVTPETPTVTPETPTVTPEAPTPTPQEPTPTPQEPTSTPVTITPEAPTPTPQEPTPTPQEPTTTPVTTTPEAPTPTPVTPTPGQPTPTPEEPTEVPVTPTMIIPVTGETPTPQPTQPEPTKVPPTDVPTLTVPDAAQNQAVLIPVTGAEQMPLNPFDIARKVMLNGGIALIGIALVLQGIYRKFE